MKKLAAIFIISGLFFTGTASAAEKKQNPCQTDCSCNDSQVFKPLFPQYEVQLPLEG